MNALRYLCNGKSPPASLEGSSYSRGTMYEQLIRKKMLFQALGSDQVAPLSLASPSVVPVFSAFSGCPSPLVLVASLTLKLWSKSWMMSSMCSMPTEMRIRSSVTPESIFSWSLSCSWVVVQGWMASVLASPTLGLGLVIVRTQWK